MIQSLSEQSRSLQSAQQVQEESQLRMQHHLETGIEIVQSKLVVVGETANSLHSTLHEAAQSVAGLTSLVSLINKSWTLLSLPVFIGILVLGGPLMNPRWVSLFSGLFRKYVHRYAEAC